MDWDISMSLFVSVVFGHIVKIIPSHNNCSLHFCGDNDALEDFASDGYFACEGTFLIDVLRFNGFFGCFESQSDILEIPNTRTGFLSKQFLAVKEDVLLFLEGSLMLRINSDKYLVISHLIF